MSSKLLSENRIEYLDVFRGIGILAMVMGHVGFGTVFDKFIHAFHMPMWFFIFGYLISTSRTYETMKAGAYLNKKAKSLLVPYFSFGLLFFLIWSAANYQNWEPTMLWHLFFVNTDQLAYVGALWFLTALFFADCIYFCIRRLIKKNALQHGAVVLLALFGNIATSVLPFRLPWALDAALVGVGLMHVGYLAGKYEKNQEGIRRLLNLNWPGIIVLAMLVTGMIFLNGHINMRNGTYAFIPLFWLNAVGACAVGFSACKKLCEVRWFSFIKGYFASVGKDSIVSLCLNQAMIYLLAVKLGLYAIRFPIGNALVLIVTMLSLWICAIPLVHTKLKIVIGK